MEKDTRWGFSHLFCALLCMWCNICWVLWFLFIQRRICSNTKTLKDPLKRREFGNMICLFLASLYFGKLLEYQRYTTWQLVQSKKGFTSALHFILAGITIKSHLSCMSNFDMDEIGSHTWVVIDALVVIQIHLKLETTATKKQLVPFHLRPFRVWMRCLTTNELVSGWWAWAF